MRVTALLFDSKKSNPEFVAVPKELIATLSISVLSFGTLKGTSNFIESPAFNFFPLSITIFIAVTFW